MLQNLILFMVNLMIKKVIIQVLLIKIKVKINQIHLLIIQNLSKFNNHLIMLLLKVSLNKKISSKIKSQY